MPRETHEERAVVVVVRGPEGLGVTEELADVCTYRVIVDGKQRRVPPWYRWVACRRHAVERADRESCNLRNQHDAAQRV